MTDMVNHPPHYTAHPSGVECIDITEHFNFNLGNAIKYIWRAEGKGQPTHDLQKAAWYVNREIQRLTEEINTGFAAHIGNHEPQISPALASEDDWEIHRENPLNVSTNLGVRADA